MIIELKRDTCSPDFTFGRIYVDGQFQCETLEDAVREIDGKPVLEWKVYGKTAIPRGTYKIIVDFSNRFQRNLPRLLQVPGFDGVRIHPGNTAADTEGCILVGSGRGPNSITQSRKAFDKLFDLIYDAKSRGEKVTITIT